MYFKHTSVLTDNILDLAPKHTQTILDCTLGSGGHSRKLLGKFPNARLFGIDRDSNALKSANFFLKSFEKNITLNQANFSELKECCFNWKNPFFDYILADIGTSSEQLDRPERGFSFNKDGPLDMRMDRDRQQITAAYLINNLSKNELLKILKTFGEERFASKIVHKILMKEKKDLLKPLKILLKLFPDQYQKNFKKKI